MQGIDRNKWYRFGEQSPEHHTDIIAFVWSVYAGKSLTLTFLEALN